MPKQDQKDEWRRADDEVRKNLPPGVKLVRTLRRHTGWIGRIAWSPDGRWRRWRRTIQSACRDIWSRSSGLFFETQVA
jgi:hypothetical protein